MKFAGLRNAQSEIVSVLLFLFGATSIYSNAVGMILKYVGTLFSRSQCKQLAMLVRNENKGTTYSILPTYL